MIYTDEMLLQNKLMGLTLLESLIGDGSASTEEAHATHKTFSNNFSNLELLSFAMAVLVEIVDDAATSQMVPAPEYLTLVRERINERLNLLNS